MNLTDIKEQLEEVKRLRNNTSAKVSIYKRKGKDTTDLEKQLQGLRARVAELTALEKLTKETPKTTPKAKPAIEEYKVKTISEEEQAQMRKASERANMELTGIAPKSWNKVELNKCKKQADKILEDNDWAQGYQFRSSEWMFIKNISTRVLPDSVELTYTIQYKTRNHRVEKTVTKYFNPETILSLNKYIEQVELWVMLNSGDMDNKEIVFGARFNMVQFEAQGFNENGWIIYK